MPRTAASQNQHAILMADDVIETLRATGARFEREGYTVLSASSCDEALSLLQSHEVQLLLANYVMPGMNVEQLIHSVRLLDPSVQIILQVAHGKKRPPRTLMAELDVQGCHDKADGVEKLLVWVDAALRTHRLVAALRARERLQNEMVANISHELCTPLHIIGGYTELLREGEFGHLPAAATRPLRSIAEATHTLSELVTDFLGCARLESGVVQLREHWVSTADLGREIKRLAGFLLEGKDVSCELHLAGAPGALLTDSLKLRTILRNLVTNAARFTSKGSISLRFSRARDELRIAVCDTGPGIPPEERERIFAPAAQPHGLIRRVRADVGLGLALSRHLALILGGDLEVESELGVGSTITLVLPATVAATAEAHELPPQINDEIRCPTAWAIAEER